MVDFVIDEKKEKLYTNNGEIIDFKKIKTYNKKRTSKYSALKTEVFANKDSIFTKEDVSTEKDYFVNNFYRIRSNNLTTPFLSRTFGIKKGDFDVNKILTFSRCNPYISEFMNAREFSFKMINGEKTICYFDLKDENKTKNQKTKFSKFKRNKDNEIDELFYVKEREAVDTTIDNIHYTYAFVIDIDFHAELKNEEQAKYFVDWLIFQLSLIGIEFDSAVYTGRGLQLLMNYNKADITVRKIKSLVQDCYDLCYKVIKEIATDLIKDIYKDLYNGEVKYQDAKVKVDKLSPLRPLGRMPGSINMRNGKTCSVVYVNFEKRRTKLGELIKVCKEYLKIESSGNKYIEFKRKGNRIGSFSQVNYKRIKAFVSLLRYFPEGRRHNIYNYIILNYMMLGKDDNYIVKKVSEIEREINTCYFSSDSKINSHVNSVRRWYIKQGKDNNGQIYFTNSTILEKLNLSREDIDFIPECKTLLTYSKKEQKEQTKIKHNNILNNLFDCYMSYWEKKITKGIKFTKKIIYDTIGIDPKTYNKYIEELRDRIVEAKNNLLKTWSNKLNNLIEEENNINNFILDELVNINRSYIGLGGMLVDNLNGGKIPIDIFEEERIWIEPEEWMLNI